jgi:hypothetical protein
MTERDEWFFRIKTATRALVKIIGRIEDAAIIAGVSRSVMHRWASTTDADIITLTAAMKLEAECGVPCVTEAMAERHGSHLVRADGTLPPPCMMTAFGGLADEFGDVTNRIAEAMRDGDVSPNEHAAICDDLNRLILAANAMQGTSASLRAVDENRRSA